MSDSLVQILKEVAADFEKAGDRADGFLSDVRARTLTVTLEAVKAGVQPGKLRDAVAELRAEVGRRADELARVRLELTRQTGIALARAATLARESEGLHEARRVASWIGWFFAERARELALLASDADLRHAVSEGRAAATGPWLRLRPGPPAAGVRVVIADGEPVLRADGIEARLPWDPLRVALLRGDAAGLIALSEGRLPEVPSREVRVWCLIDDKVLGATHNEPAPYETSWEDGLVHIGRRPVAVATIPALVPGMERFRLVVAPPPEGAPASPWLPGVRGQVLRFPGV